ncbi:NAD(P)/FAD-dependent oxidoreductase [Kribbella sp. GL6]|uniref:NAD(P)/FAD-dependent oxidoreductase n=1 Tax=Kribbella sp. GL6 TaxID=3419765 RepID=UPI003D043FA9
MTRQRYVIVGGGVAAASAAAGLRSHGFDGEVVMVSDDPVLPYERPPLSKQVLAQPTQPEPTYLKPESWYADNDVTAMLKVRATAFDPRARTVELSTGESLRYSGLLLATGVRARTLPGVEGEHVLTLRSLADASLLRRRLAAAQKIVVLGGGFIGCEVAASAVALGKRVTIVERTASLMEAALGPALGEVLTDVHRAAGVQLVLRSVVQQVTDTASHAVVHTTRGVVEADLVLIGAGTVPNTELAGAAGLDLDGGVVTDEYSRTSVPGVYAAGDVASIYHPYYGKRLRVEHHDTAMHHGISAAKNMLGTAEPFREPHWFWSDQYSHTLHQVGRAEPGDELVVRGSMDDLSFSAFYLRDSRITKVISLNRPKDVLVARRLLFSEHTATKDLLLDESLPLNRLAPRRSTSRAEAS